MDAVPVGTEADVEAVVVEGKIVVEGGPLGGAHAAGAFLSPTLYRIADTASPLVQEEHFGPLVSIETFQDEAEAAAMANATRYGLSASIWTRDVARTLRVGRALKTGTVWVNGHGKLIPEAETGGYGDSGLGRLHGVEALADFLETKHLYVEAGADLQRASFH